MAKNGKVSWLAEFALKCTFFVGAKERITAENAKYGGLFVFRCKRYFSIL